MDKYLQQWEKWKGKMTALLMVIELIGSIALLVVASQTLGYLAQIYREATLTINIIFYASPIIAFLLARETDRVVFLYGVFILFAYVAFVDWMYAFGVIRYADASVLQEWLSILPVAAAAGITYLDYRLIKRARILRYCPSCRERIKLENQNYCHNCGEDLSHAYGDLPQSDQ